MFKSSKHLMLVLALASTGAASHATELPKTLHPAELTESEVLSLSSTSGMPGFAADYELVSNHPLGADISPEKTFTFAGVSFPGGLAMAKRADGNVWVMTGEKLGPWAQMQSERNQLLTEMNRQAKNPGVTHVTRCKDSNRDPYTKYHDCELTSWEAVGPNGVKAEVSLDRAQNGGILFLNVEVSAVHPVK
jgi:hypothetical protein